MERRTSYRQRGQVLLIIEVSEPTPQLFPQTCCVLRLVVIPTYWIEKRKKKVYIQKIKKWEEQRVSRRSISHSLTGLCIIMHLQCTGRAAHIKERIREVREESPNRRARPGNTPETQGTSGSIEEGLMVEAMPSGLWQTRKTKLFIYSLIFIIKYSPPFPARIPHSMETVFKQFPGRVCRVKGNGRWSGQYRWYYYRRTNLRPTVGTIYILTDHQDADCMPMIRLILSRQL